MYQKVPYNSNDFILITEFRALCKRASRRKGHAFRPGTVGNHITMATKFIKFCQRFDLQYLDPSEQTLCAYIEYLAQSFKSYKSVANYMGGSTIATQVRGGMRNKFG